MLVGAVLVGVSSALLLLESHGGDYIPSDVRVDGVPVGGLAPQEAARKLELHANARAQRRLLLHGPRRRITTTGATLGMTAQVEVALGRDRAGRVGFVRHLLRIGRRRDLTLRYDIPAENVQALAKRLGATRAIDARIRVSAAGIHVRRARPGRAVDVAGLQSQLSTLPAQVVVATVAIPSQISTEAARVATARARRLTSFPRTLLIGDQAHALAPRDLRSLLVIRRAQAGFRIEFDPDRLAPLLPSPTDPRDARLVIEGERVRVVPAVPGRTVDLRGTAVALANPARAKVKAAVSLVQPAVTTAALAALAIKERVSEFTTFYPAGQPRVINIRRASSVIDGTILRPGATFSMNDALGERTVKKGYVAAPQIVGSSFADSVGGGISQVATMLYNGAFFAGLELIEHQPHSLYIDRYPLGREATISWGGPELIFRNDWPAALLIKLVATKTSITVRFFSSRLGRRVQTRTFAPYGHGGGGFTVEYTRRVYRNATLLRDERYRVRYGVATTSGP